MSVPPPYSSHVDLLPLDESEWEWKAFERFCLGFVRALPDVESANLYGTRGQDQQGIDIEARLTDGRTRTYQCRKWQRYTKRNAEKTVEETEKDADEHVILVTCEVGTEVRKYIDGLDDWSVLDKEDISRGVREIEPRERARRLIEDTFTVHWRRAFLGPEGPLAFWETDEYFRWALDAERLFRHTWDLVGRAELLAALKERIADDHVRIIIVPGRGGIGKTRVLRAFADDLKNDRTVLFADDEVPLTAEAVDELPWTEPVVVVDDAHRRDDLGVLFAAVRRRRDPITVVLATRPQRLEELRASVSRVGFGSGEVWVAEPLQDLAEADVEALARQALGQGQGQEQHARRLAEATADCPLVTVIGGQLLAQRAVQPELLEREQEFRETVLDRFRDEMLGRLSDEVDKAAARGALVLVAALGPLSVEHETALTRMAEDLGLTLPALRSLLSDLEKSGLLIARGRLRRIVPDVLADHILYRACIDHQGNPTGRSDELLGRYGDVALAALLRNLAELDWRIGQTRGNVALLTPFWQGISQQFQAAGAEGRLSVIELVKPVAALAPGPVFELVRYALANPARPGPRVFGHELTDNDVRRVLPPLAGSVALTYTHLPDALEVLWQLGRDDDRPLHQWPDHPLRILAELASYQLPLPWARAQLELVQRLIADRDEAERHAQSPLELLRPLLAREGMTTKAAGLGFRMGSYGVSAEGTASIRAAVREILVEQAVGGNLRNRVIAAEMLAAALTLPHGYFGQAVEKEQRDQWHDDQLAILDSVEQVLDATDDPHVRFALRDKLRWHATRGRFEDASARASQLLEREPTERELLVRNLREPIDFRDREGSHARLAEYARTLANTIGDANELAERLDAEVAELYAAQEEPRVNARPLLAALAEVSPELGEGLSTWCVANSSRPLARFSDALLIATDARNPDTVREQLETLRGGDVEARRQLASYLSGGSWFEALDGPEAEMLAELVADEDPFVVDTSLVTVLRLAQYDPKLAISIALQANIGTDSHLADELCMSIGEVADQLDAAQVRALLDKLRPVTELEYWPNEVLGKLASSYRDEVLAFLLERAAAGGEVRTVPFHDYDADLLGGAEGEELLGLLRRVRDAGLGADSGLRWELNRLYWRLTGDLDARLEVLLEWVGEASPERRKAALAMLEEMPWDAVLVAPDFVGNAFAAAAEQGATAVAELRATLLSATVMNGDHSRTMGEPPPRDLRLRDEGQPHIQRFPVGSPARSFFEEVVARAEQNIAEARQEDEEFPERG